MAKLFQIAIVIALAYITAYYTSSNQDNKGLLDFKFNFDIEKLFDFDIGKFIEENFEESNTDNIDVLMSDGKYYYEKKDFYSALNLFKKVIEIDPYYVEANYYLASTYENLSDFYKAETIYKSLIQDSVYLSESFTGLSKIYLSKSITDSALITINKAIEADTSNNLAFNQRAKYFLFQKDTTSALKDLETSSSISATYETYFEMAVLNYDKKDFIKTIEYISKCLEFNNADLYSCYYKRALSYYYLKDYTNSIKNYKLALELDNSDSYLYYNIAIAYDNMNDTSNAYKYYDLFSTSTQKYDEFYDYSVKRTKELKNNEDLMNKN